MVLRSIGLVAAAWLAGCATVTAPTRPADLVIANVTVIDPETRKVSAGRDVYVAGGRIAGIVRGGARSGFTALETVRGDGRFLIPGLIDMHAHLFLPEEPTPTLNLLLANGVTGIREMSSDCWANAGAKRGCVGDYRALQARIATGEVAGPELIGLTSTMVMGPTRLTLPATAPKYITPTTAEEGRELVAYLAARGTDLIKTHDSIPDPAFRALMAEARARGMKTGGHVPFAAGSLGAARMGYASIEHARDLLYDCSRYGPEFRRREAAFADGEAAAKRPANVERLQRTVTEFDPTQCAAFLKSLAATGVYYVPTHVTREMEARAAEPGYRSDPARQHVLKSRNANWDKDLDETAALPVAERDALRRFFEHGLVITGLAYRAGIPIMAGTDLNDTMIVPGFSLHRELGLLRRAGLTPMDALRSATSVPATYFGRSDLGGIAPGKRADLVLLDADPLADSANTARVAAVFSRGRVYRRADLDRLLAEAKAAAQR